MRVVFPCHVEPAETSSRKAHTDFEHLAPLDPSALLRMTIWVGHPHPIRFLKMTNADFLSVLCAYRAYEYIFYNIYTICAISLLDLSEIFLIFHFFVDTARRRRYTLYTL